MHSFDSNEACLESKLPNRWELQCDLSGAVLLCLIRILHCLREVCYITSYKNGVSCFVKGELMFIMKREVKCLDSQVMCNCNISSPLKDHNSRWISSGFTFLATRIYVTVHALQLVLRNYFGGHFEH